MHRRRKAVGDNKVKVGSLVKIRRTNWIGTVLLEEQIYVLVYWMKQEHCSWEFKQDLKLLCE